MDNTPVNTNGDEWMLPEDVEARKKLAHLQDEAHKGALFADWARQQVSILLFKWLDEQIQDSKNAWLSAPDREKAESVRLQAQAFSKTKSWIYAQIKAGDMAADGIKQLRDEGVELTGWIKPPTPK
jgi:hypothetical protein